VIGVEEALSRVLERTPTLPDEPVELAQAADRVLAEDVLADADLPSFDRAAMDGYAVRSGDATRAPVVLRVVGRIRAGEEASRTLEAGEAVQIMTGAPVPPGADAVQQVEKTRALDGGARVELLHEVGPGQNVAPRGSEVRAGERVLERGRRLDPAAIGVLAAVGQAHVRVGGRPAVAILVTGDELVDASERPGAGRIRDSNGPALSALARAAGAVVAPLGREPDDTPRLVAALRRGLESDVLVVSGGVSAGVFDLVEGAFAELGVAVCFDRVAIKPGAPLVFGTRGRTLVFGLPGNPVSAQVAFELFVRPALLRMQGATSALRRRVEVELLGPVRNASGRRSHLPAEVAWQDGRLVARPVRSAGSADLVAHARANALVILEPERRGAEAGERAPALLLGRFAEDAGAA
jgi:molybdenum cofactor synthesis domain-containing protein